MSRRVLGSGGGLLTCILALFPVAAFAQAGDPPAPCEEVSPASIASPDGKWTAKVFGEVCDLGFSTSTAVVVDLFRTSDPKISQTILSVGMPSSRAAWPKVHWESPSKIGLQMFSRTDIALLVAYYQGIDIVASYCPGSPADRAAWIEYKAAYRKWVADTSAWSGAGPKPKAPTPPKTSDSDLSCEK